MDFSARGFLLFPGGPWASSSVIEFKILQDALAETK